MPAAKPAQGANMTGNDPILSAAAEWHASMSGDDPDFDGFAAWLEESQAHRDAYDRIILADAWVDDYADRIRTSLPANDTEPSGTKHRRFWPMLVALAATLALALVFAPRFLEPTPIIESAGQNVRTIALGDATSIRLDAGSALRLEKGDDRRAELLRGRAYFTVEHDAERPFALAVGDIQIRDVGTRFEVHRTATDVTVSVAEGAVAVGRRGMAFVQAKAGEQLVIRNGTIEKRRIEPAEIAGWSEGRLIYDNAPLVQVVADINRYTQKKLALAPGLSEQRFSGVLNIGDGSQLARNLADLMGFSLSETADGQLLVARP